MYGDWIGRQMNRGLIPGTVKNCFSCP